MFSPPADVALTQTHHRWHPGHFQVCCCYRASERVERLDLVGQQSWRQRDLVEANPKRCLQVQDLLRLCLPVFRHRCRILAIHLRDIFFLGFAFGFVLGFSFVNIFGPVFGFSFGIRCGSHVDGSHHHRRWPILPQDPLILKDFNVRFIVDEAAGQ